MEQKSTSRHHFRGNRPQILGSCLTIFSRSLLLLLSVSIWVTGCGKDGDVVKNFFGGGGATGDGGGGQGIQCDKTATNADIRNRLFVRDIYEAVVNKELKMKVIPGASGTDEVSDEALEILAGSLKSYFGPASYSLEFTKASFWKRLVNAIVFLEDDHQLLASQDANSPIHLQKGCSIVQIAFWDESSGVANEHTLYVNRKYWRSLDALNKIALLAHEVFYAQARKSQYKNSDTVRAKVGQLLSQEGLAPLFKEWVPSKNVAIKDTLPASVKGYKSCEGFSPDDPEAKLYFYQYEGKDGKQHLTFPIVSSNTINSAFLQSASFSFDISVNQVLALATDALYFQTAFHDARSPRDLFVERWFTNSYLLNIGQTSVQTYLESLPSKIGKESVLWTGHLMSSPTPITVTLLNTMGNWNARPEAKIRTREEQIERVNEDLLYRFTNCGISTADSEALIALLHNEINTNIQSGKYPRDFPLWNKRLSQLTKDIPTQESGYSLCDLAHQTSRYPAYLYSLILKTNKLSDGEDLFGSWILTDNSVQDIPLGKLRLTQGMNKLDFDLRCYDFATAYAETTTHQQLKSAATVSSRKITSRLPEVMPDHTAEQINLIGKFMNVLSGEGEQNQKSFSLFMKSLNPAEFHRYDRPEQVRAFLADLQSEKHLVVDMCTQNIIADYDGQNEKYKNSGCLVTTMQSTGRRYMVYFAYLLPNEPGTDPEWTKIPDLEFVQLLP